MERLIHQWWDGKIAPALRNGQHIISRDDAYPLYELLHAIEDNVKLDLRESDPRFFKDYPIEHLLSYYPAALSGAGERLLHRRGARSRRSGSAIGHAFPRGGVGHGGL